MSIGNQLVFDINGNVEDFIFILSTKDFRHLGALQNVVSDSVHNSGNLMSANDISFEVYKTIEKEIDETMAFVDEPLWDEIDNLKLIYIRELNEYFEMSVQLDDTTESIKKTVTCTSLCESELGQLGIHGLEVNTEVDISRPDYIPTIFYNIENTKASLLDRIVSSFAPNYTIKHVDESLWKIQRTFSVDGTNVYDWFMGECSKEFNCIFMFDSTERGIYVYDLSTVCKDCGYRGEYIDKCPKCGSANLDTFGDDTGIYIDKENLTDAIQLTTDKDSIKNCFKLVAGDDVMTAMVRLINPNGSSFIYKPTDKQLAEMPVKLQEKLSKYDELYNSKQSEYEGILVDIFEASGKIDELTHTMMPSVEYEEVTAQSEANKLNSVNLNLLGMSVMSSSTSPSKSTVESSLLTYARVFVNTGAVKISINNSSYSFKGIGSDGWNYGTWTGNFKVESYTDKKDIAYSPTITVKITEDYGTFIEQKIMKNISNDSDDEYSVFDVLSIEDLDDFREALKLYCLNRLKSFYDAIQTALTALLELDQASEEADYYEAIYLPYYKKLQACQEEINIRQSEIDNWQNIYDNLILQQEELQAELNFEDYFGEDFYKIYNLYRREDVYQNNNYISDGLNTSEQLKKAKEFFEVANQELEKARTPKHSISSTLHNLLIIPEFKPLIHKFKLGNWLRICVDGEIYRLRLVGYRLSFSSIQTLEITFSSVTKVNSPVSERDELFSLVKSIGSTYDYYAAQSKKGNESYVEINRWLEKGLNSALVNIKNNNNEDPILDKHGIWGRAYDSVTGNILPEQFRATHNLIAMTEDNWLTSSLAIGKHNYVYFDKTTQSFKEGIGYGVSSKFLQAPFIHGGQMIASELLSENYSPITGKGAYLNLNDGAFSLADSRLVYDPVTNKLTIKGVDIEWSSSTTPEIDDIDGLADDLANKNESINANSASIKMNSDAITAEVKRASESEGKLSSKIEQTAESITSSVSKQIEETKKYADDVANEAETNANNNTTDKLKSYSTTTEMNSVIQQTASSITSTVNKQITETKEFATSEASKAESNANSSTDEKLKDYSTTDESNAYADNAANNAEKNANANTANKLKSYSTTTEMNSAIEQTAENITSTVNKDIEETKTYFNGKIEETNTSLSSKIEQTAESITSTISKTYVTNSSMQDSVNNLQKQIDGAIETFTGNQVPTLTNYPANEWTTNEVKDTHIGDLYMVNSEGGDHAGFYYRFEKTGTTYKWTLLKDSEVTKALQDAKEANDRANAIANDLATNYSTTVEMNSAIKQTEESITLSVDKKVTETKEYADTVSSNAESNANNNTIEKLKSYSTTTQMNSAIDQKANEINLSVSSQITETKTYASNVANTAQTNAIADTTEKLKSYSTTTQMNAAIDLKANAITSKVNAVETNLSNNYSTTTQMNTAITQSANNITSTVSATYETKSDAQSRYNTLQTSITQNANNIALKVSQTDYNGKQLVSLINQTSEAVTIDANKINLNGVVTANNYFKINTNGSVEAISGKIGGWNISGSELYSQDDTKGFYVRIHRPNELGTIGNGNADVFVIRNGTSSSGYTYPFVLSSDGTFMATKANIIGSITTGNITVTGGSIKIGSTFNVSNTGVLTCSGADISGKITASSGNIAGWTIGSTSLTSGTFNTSGFVGLYTSYPTDANYRMVIGSKFKVNKDGEITATGGKIGGWNISSSYLSGSKGEYVVRLYPNGYSYSGNTYFLVIFKQYGEVPIGGIHTGGWSDI